MPSATRSLALSLVLIGAAGVAGGAFAESSIASSASDSLSASVGKMSDSISTSSDSSSKHTDVAQGDYQVVAMAAAAGRPGMTALQLQPVAAGAGRTAFTLTLPAETVARNGLAVGQVVSALERPYGVAFARAETHQAFYLVMQDAWHRELDARKVS